MKNRNLGSLGEIELVRTSGSDLDIVNGARVSYGVRKTELEEKDIRLINYLVKHDHMSPFEHTQLTFRVKCPKPIAVQWMRHRTWSYNEISGRYVELEEEAYIPSKFRQQAKSNKQASIEGEFTEAEQDHILRIYEAALSTSYNTYKRLLLKGVAKEQARMVLPFGFMTEFEATVNLRNFIHWYKLRDHEGAQYEIQQFARAAIQLVEESEAFKHSISAFKNR